MLRICMLFLVVIHLHYKNDKSNFFFLLKYVWSRRPKFLNVTLIRLRCLFVSVKIPSNVKITGFFHELLLVWETYAFWLFFIQFFIHLFSQKKLPFYNKNNSKRKPKVFSKGEGAFINNVDWILRNSYLTDKFSKYMSLYI